MKVLEGEETAQKKFVLSQSSTMAPDQASLRVTHLCPRQPKEVIPNLAESRTSEKNGRSKKEKGKKRQGYGVQYAYATQKVVPSKGFAPKGQSKSFGGKN